MFEVCTSFEELLHQLGHDPEFFVSNHTDSKAQRLNGQSLGLGDLYSFSLARFCPNGFSL